ncbi:MAG: hypothetical protein C4586_08260 [Anaerolineaceae bacterium]|nr:MAG: hypothetical protein C4586_08260 [Anaerolineaceae bacterium]
MADVFTPTNYYKYALKKKLVNESTDTIRMLCMRSGFVFSTDNHAQLKNIRTNTGAINLVWAAADNSVSRTDGGSFISDGFVQDNKCTSNDTLNPGPFTVATVTASKITFNEAVVNSTAVKTLSSDDELATASGGYTQNSKSIGTVTVTQNNTYNRCDATAPTVSINAVSASIGPTPGVMFYDVTADVIIGYLQFTTEVTKAAGTALNVGNIVFRLT